MKMNVAVLRTRFINTLVVISSFFSFCSKEEGRGDGERERGEALVMPAYPVCDSGSVEANWVWMNG